MKITVGELIAQLETFDHDTQVALSQDEEGNGFSAFVGPELYCGVVVLFPSGMQDIDELEDFVDDEEEVE